MFAIWLECEYEGMLDTPMNFNQLDAWNELGGVYKVLHRIITYNLNVRIDSNGSVFAQDLKLMFATLHGIQVDIVRWLIHKLYCTKHDSHAIQLGMLISFIVQKFKLNLV